MSVNRKEVFILKSHSDDEDRISYEQLMSDAGLSPKTIPVLDFEYLNLDLLRDSLKQPSEFSGIIFTSPRGVKAVLKTLGSAANLPEEWREYPVFVVGESTKKLLNDELNIRGQSGVTENAVGLAEVIIRRTYPNRLLFPCSDIRRDTLPSMLLEKKIAVKEIPVYHTKQHPLFEKSLRDATAQGQYPEFIIFFSPSGVRYSLPVLQQLRFPLEKIKIVVIGTTTLAAAKELNLDVWSCATRPTPQQILNAVVEHA